MTSMFSRIAGAAVVAASLLAAPMVQAQGYGPSPGYGPTPGYGSPKSGYGKGDDGYGYGRHHNPDLKCWTTTSGRYYCGNQDPYDSYDRYGDRHDDRYAHRYGNRYDNRYDDHYGYRYSVPPARPYGYSGYGTDEHGRTCTYDRFGRLACWYGDGSGYGAQPYQDPAEAAHYQLGRSLGMVHAVAEHCRAFDLNRPLVDAALAKAGMTLNTPTAAFQQGYQLGSHLSKQIVQSYGVDGFCTVSWQRFGELGAIWPNLLVKATN
ncbi:MAG TPA: hypothetical protein PK264_05395 [Hyphomicrobiaceae bacterium]|nr:hypothetical protein [Hyphomicrobiaceae bacterium]